MKKHILIIDDEKVALRPYQQALELGGYSVDIISESYKCKEFIENPLNIITDMFIIDIMMPSERIYSNSKTNSGLLTGLYLANDIRKLDQDTPILFWSAGIFPEIIQQTKDLSKKLNNCAFIRKNEYLPDDLVKLVNSYFDKDGFKSGFFKTLWDSLLFQPNFNGVGIDLKKLKR